jgi:hypothetical protein
MMKTHKTSSVLDHVTKHHRMRPQNDDPRTRFNHISVYEFHSLLLLHTSCRCIFISFEGQTEPHFSSERSCDKEVSLFLGYKGDTNKRQSMLLLEICSAFVQNHTV